MPDTSEIPPRPTHAPDMTAPTPPQNRDLAAERLVEDFWTRPRPPVVGTAALNGIAENLAALTEESRQARLDAAIPLKADDADHLIDWPKVRRAATALRRALQLWPNTAAATVVLAGPAWLWRSVVADASGSFAPAADIADPGLCLGLMALTGVLIVRHWVRRLPLGRTIARLAAWTVVLGTLTHPPALAWAIALATAISTGALR
ncbi:hypothetical protein [Kitasatospora sp. P5_F3]